MSNLFTTIKAYTEQIEQKMRIENISKPLCDMENIHSTYITETAL